MASGKLFNRNLLVSKGAGIYNGDVTTSVYLDGSPQGLTDAGAANVTSFKTNLTTTGAAAVTLADGTHVGQLKLIQMIVDAGDATVTPSNLSGGTTITYADVGDAALLKWDGSNWIVLDLYNLADGVTSPVLA